MVHGIGGDQTVEGVLVHPFRSVVHGRLGLVPSSPFRVGRVKVLGRPVAPRRDGRSSGDDDDRRYHAIVPHAVMDVLAVRPARGGVHGAAHLLRPAHGEVSRIKLPAAHEVVRGAAHAKERLRVEVVAGRHVHVREQAERQIGLGREGIRLEDEESPIVRLFNRQCAVGERNPPFRAIVPFQRKSAHRGKVRLPHDPRGLQFPAVRIDVLPSRRRRDRCGRKQRQQRKRRPRYFASSVFDLFAHLARRWPRVYGSQISPLRRAAIVMAMATIPSMTASSAGPALSTTMSTTFMNRS